MKKSRRNSTGFVIIPGVCLALTEGEGVTASLKGEF